MLVAQNISYSSKKFDILKSVNLEIAGGKIVSIIGPNGAGKSTLLGVLSGELPTKGNVFFKGKSYADWNSQILAQHKAKFSQQYSTDIPLLVKDVVIMGRYPYFENNPTEIDITAVTKAMSKTDVIHLQEREYNTLSGGEKQRVHLARVLAQVDNAIPNKLIFFDEPLNNLDIYHQHNILENIKQLALEDNTVVLVMHDLNLAARFSDEIILMKEGRIVNYNQPEKVFTEQIITQTYNFPCKIIQNPIDGGLMVVFG
ncbi:MAG: heme ABC transporter ATP-binding protein [Bacteroidota bacterium]|nr:heme ABC transporter ATP-binding protein [Bacteroidota bacterium]